MCLERVWKVSGSCLEAVSKVSGMKKIIKEIVAPTSVPGDSLPGNDCIATENKYSCHCFSNKLSLKMNKNKRRQKDGL